jgi:ribA/ribD-fused uncharacterized protein
MNDEKSIYRPENGCVFRKVKEEFGGLSNMSNDFKIRVNGILIHNSEALYQSCRFPYDVEIQEQILIQKSAMSAKMKSKHYRKEHTREDWDEIRVEVMRWCLRVKLSQNLFGFGRLLESTGDKPIIELSHNDQFWGTTDHQDGTLQGQNVLGKLLMKLREDYRQGLDDFKNKLVFVEPPEIDNFFLLGEPILPVGRKLLKTA